MPYVPTFIVGGREGSHAFANDGHIVEWLGQVWASNREHGMRNIAVVSIEGTA